MAVSYQKPKQKHSGPRVDAEASVGGSFPRYYGNPVYLELYTGYQLHVYRVEAKIIDLIINYYTQSLNAVVNHIYRIILSRHALCPCTAMFSLQMQVHLYCRGHAFQDTFHILPVAAKDTTSWSGVESKGVGSKQPWLY